MNAMKYLYNLFYEKFVLQE